MVRINLLPVRQVKRRAEGRQTLVLFGLILVLGIVGNFVWYSMASSAANASARQVQRTQDEIKNLEKVIGEVQNITKDQKALEDKLKVLDTLKRGRTGPVKLLDAIASVVPKKVWLLSMKEAGGTMTFTGTALTHDDLAELIGGLQNVVWTPKGIARIVEGKTSGVAKLSHVELLSSGTIEDFGVQEVKPFFTDVNLKKAQQKDETQLHIKLVDFEITCRADYAT
jgi:type IV pilus assembly protein PilN